MLFSLLIQYILIRQEISDADDEYTILIVVWYYIILHYDDFPIGVPDKHEWPFFLQSFLCIFQRECALDIEALIMAFCIEVDLKLFLGSAAFFVCVVLLDHPDPDRESSISEFVKYDGFHKMVDLCLSETEYDVSEACILEVILAQGTNVFLPFYIITFCLADKKRILQMTYVAAYRSFAHLCLLDAAEGISKLCSIGKRARLGCQY